MRLTPQKVEEVIFRIVREDGLELVALLKGKENVSEFDIATKLKKDIKLVRRMLYFLYNKNLVSFTRKKDKQKGWYIYYWTLEMDAIKFEYIKQKKQTLERLEATLEKEQKEVFYVCSDTCVRLDMNESLDYDFHCPECGNLLEQDENSEKISRLNKRIADLKVELEAIHKSEAIRLEKAAAKAKEERLKEEAEAKEASNEKRRETIRKKKEALAKKNAAKEAKSAKKKTAKAKVAKPKKAAKKKSPKKKAATKKKTAEK